MKLFKYVCFLLTFSVKALELVMSHVQPLSVTEHNKYHSQLLYSPEQLVQVFYDAQQKARENKNEQFIEYMPPQYPLSLLSECTATFCGGSRLLNPGFRKDAETFIVNKMKEAYDKKGFVNYVDFGSGMLFQTLTTLAKAVDAGIKHINLKLIDTVYNPLCFAAKKGEIETLDLSTFPFTSQFLSQIATEEHESVETIEKTLRSYIPLFQQFFIFLKGYSDLNITISVYGSALEYLSKHSLPHDADIMAMIDLAGDDGEFAAIDMIPLIKNSSPGAYFLNLTAEEFIIAKRTNMPDNVDENLLYDITTEERSDYDEALYDYDEDDDWDEDDYDDYECQLDTHDEL